jgi:hypothetical protein
MQGITLEGEGGSVKAQERGEETPSLERRRRRRRRHHHHHHHHHHYHHHHHLAVRDISYLVNLFICLPC